MHIFGKHTFLILTILFVSSSLFSQNISNNPGSNHGNKFEQLGTILPTPNEYRTASGSPGHQYWQQKADYKIKCTLDEVNYRLTGSETITYHNNSPDQLIYLWLQLDENQHSSLNNANYQNENKIPETITENDLKKIKENIGDNGFGHHITSLTDAAGQPLKYTINKTMMRIELPHALKTGEKFVFNLDWYYNIVNRLEKGGRGGYELFKDDGNALFTMTQWYPRMCVYSDFQGWQNQQFSGRAEFALTFGDFDVEMTVPADHIICATGECQNYQNILSPTQKTRWASAQKSSEPVEIVTLDEAIETEKKRSKAKNTWHFKATNVRDFAWGSSRKFIWDAMPVEIEGKKIMAMSFYGKEAYGLYRKFSTKVIAHTLRTYSHFTIPYPYPVAQSVEASNGMEYPMICFNYGRTEPDGTYSEGIKNGMIGVIIHEVGHNFFPMIINSDERQWSWMDEGLNTFVEYLTERLWDNNYPSRRGAAYGIVDYMKLPKDELEPIMTNSDNIINFGANAYAKPATGLNILRETIMGRELFDYAFKEYCRKWAFKHPTPADLFRTFEDASGEDLDWFWRGWFYGTDACDLSLDTVIYKTADFNGVIPDERTITYQVDKPDVPKFNDISMMRNVADPKIIFETDRDTSLRDFYWYYGRGKYPIDTLMKTTTRSSGVSRLDNAEQKQFEDIHAYEIKVSNKGGLVMPIILQWNYEDGSYEIERIPAQIWRKNENSVTKSFVKFKKVASIQLDPYKETSDINENNNGWQVQDTGSRFKAFKASQERGSRRNPDRSRLNPMQTAVGP